MSAERDGYALPALLRINAMVVRYLYLLRSSWPRIFELIYWPAVQLVTWGFLQTYLGRLPPRPGDFAVRAACSSAPFFSGTFCCADSSAFQSGSRGNVVAEHRQSDEPAATERVRRLAVIMSLVRLTSAWCPSR